MSCRLTALSIPLLFLLLVSIQGIDLAHVRSLSRILDYEFPEVDGSAVDSCGIFPALTPDPITTTTTTTTTTVTTPRPTTRKQVVAPTKKPSVQSTPKKPEPKDSGTAVRPQPAPAGPATNSHSDPVARLLCYLLTGCRGQPGGPVPWFNRFMSQPTGRLRLGGYHVMSHSHESASTLLKRMVKNRWNVGSLSSEDSSDES